MGAARSELESARSELGFARAELDAVRTRLSDEEAQRRRLQQGVDELREEHKRSEEVAVGEARRAAREETVGVKIREAEAVRGLDEERRAGAAAERRAGRLEGRMKGLEEELEAAGRRARLREEDLRDLDARLQVCICIYIWMGGWVVRRFLFFGGEAVTCRNGCARLRQYSSRAFVVADKAFLCLLVGTVGVHGHVFMHGVRCQQGMSGVRVRAKDEACDRRFHVCSLASFFAKLLPRRVSNPFPPFVHMHRLKNIRTV